MSGNSQPLVTGGVSTTLSYKGFGLNIYASFTLKRTILNNALAERFRLMGNPFGSKAVVPLGDIDMWRQPGDRSEERRVGKGGVSPCRYGWWRSHQKKNT